MTTETLMPSAPTLDPTTPSEPVAPSPTATLPDLRNPGSLLTPTDTPDPATDPATDTPTEGAEPEAPAAETPAEEPVTYQVTIPLPNGNGENGPTNAGTLDVALPTQEAADTLRYHLKQSAKAQRLESRVQATQQDVATVDFLEQHPTEGLFWMAEQHPDAGHAFLESWMKAHPERAVAALQTLGFQVTTDQYNERAIMAEAKLAQREMAERVRSGQTAFQTQMTTQAFRAQAMDAVEELASTVGLQPGTDDHAVFADLASRKLADLYKTNNGRVTGADMTAALQPLAQRFASTGSLHHSAVQPRNDVGQFAKPVDSAKLAKKNDTLRKIAGPVAPGAPVPAAVSKTPPNTSLYDLRKSVRGY